MGVSVVTEPGVSADEARRGKKRGVEKSNRVHQLWVPLDSRSLWIQGFVDVVWRLAKTRSVGRGPKGG